MSALQELLAKKRKEIDAKKGRASTLKFAPGRTRNQAFTFALLQHSEKSVKSVLLSTKA